MLSLSSYNSYEMMDKNTMKQNTRNMIASALVGASALVTSIALADDSTQSSPRSDLESAIDSLTPTSITSRGYSDGHGNYQGQTIISNDLGRFVHRGETGYDLYAINLVPGKAVPTLDGWRINAGYQSFVNTDSSADNSRLLLERNFGKDSLVDFASVELQNNSGEKQVAIAGGLNVGNFKPQIAADDEGNFSYALIFNDNPVKPNFSAGIGFKQIGETDNFNFASSYKFTSGFLEGYKFTAQARVFDPNNGKPSSDFRLRFGQKTPGGAFLVDAHDIDWGSLTKFDGGNGDGTFGPFGLGDGQGRFEFFSASNSNDSKLGSLSGDVRYHVDPASRSIRADVAVGLGSVSPTFLKDNVLQVGRTTYLDFRDQTTDVSSLELRTTLLSGDKDKKGNEPWAIKFGGRAYKNEGKNSDDNSKAQFGAFLEATVNF